VILNTSFSENEPIVCTPEEAIHCFPATRMDAPAIGPFLVVKSGRGRGNCGRVFGCEELKTREPI
jgi:carbamoyltransferase